MQTGVLLDDLTTDVNKFSASNWAERTAKFVRSAKTLKDWEWDSFFVAVLTLGCTLNRSRGIAGTDNDGDSVDGDSANDEFTNNYYDEDFDMETVEDAEDDLNLWGFS